MYTRPYNDDSHGIVIPESYGGTLLRGSENPTEINETQYCSTQESKVKNPWQTKASTPTEEVHNTEDSVSAFSFLSKLPFGNLLSNIGKNSKFSLQKIGTEEILIIATAAFLFFTKDGDKECAIMLLLLLFLA